MHFLHPLLIHSGNSVSTDCPSLDPAFRHQEKVVLLSRSSAELRRWLHVTKGGFSCKACARTVENQFYLVWVRRGLMGTVIFGVRI